MSSEIVDRYNSLFKLLSIPIEAIDGTRIVYKQKCKTITKGLMLAKLQRKGILFLDTIHGENSHYQNNYTRYPIKNREIIKGATVRFHENTATVSGLAEKRRRIVIAIRIEGLSFDIEVDPRKIEISSDTEPKAKKEQPNPDYSDAEKELESVRKRLDTTTTELEECRDERDAALSKISHIDVEELPKDVVAKLPEIQAADVKEDIQETVVELETAYKNRDTQIAQEQEKRLQELVEELNKLTPQQTVSATDSCVVIENNTAHRLEIKFSRKPSADTISKLKERKFKWDPYKKVWYAPDNGSNRAFATTLCGAESDSVKASAFQTEPQPKQSIAVRLRQLQDELLSAKVQADNVDAGDFLRQQEEMRQRLAGRIRRTFNNAGSGFTPPKFIRENGVTFELEEVTNTGREDGDVTTTYLPAQDPATRNALQIAQIEKLLAEELPDTVLIHSNNRGVTTYNCSDKRVESIAHLFKIIGTYLEKFNTTEWDDRSGINTYENVPTRDLLEHLLGKLQTTYIS